MDSETEAVVSLQLGTDENFYEKLDFDLLRETAMRVRPSAPHTFWLSSNALNFGNTHPSTDLVREWLLGDLKSAGWDP